MKVTPVHSTRIVAGGCTLAQFLDETLSTLADNTVVVVTSKVVSLCENRVVPIDGTDREALIRAESDLYYNPLEDSGYTYHFTITADTLIPAAGIDASNSNGMYVLWPRDPMASAQFIWQHLVAKHRLKSLGVIISDSTVSLSRWGTTGIAIGHCGFAPVKNYIGQADLFGRAMQLSQSNIAGGLAAAAVLTMGEGAEGTPAAIIEDIPFVTFELPQKNADTYYISPLVDAPFKPFFASIPWHRGGRGATPQEPA